MMYTVLTICKYGLHVSAEQLLNATKYKYTAASFMTTLTNDSIYGCQQDLSVSTSAAFTDGHTIYSTHYTCIAFQHFMVRVKPAIRNMSIHLIYRNLPVLSLHFNTAEITTMKCNEITGFHELPSTYFITSLHKYFTHLSLTNILNSKLPVSRYLQRHYSRGYNFLYPLELCKNYVFS